MSEPKFTPGPWFVDHGVPGKPRIFSRADNLIKSMVCACEHGALSRQEHDAALIAAGAVLLLIVLPIEAVREIRWRCRR